MTASSVSVLDGVSGIDAARLIEIWREVVAWEPIDIRTSARYKDRFRAYADQIGATPEARAELQRIAREVLS